MSHETHFDVNQTTGFPQLLVRKLMVIWRYRHRVPLKSHLKTTSDSTLCGLVRMFRASMNNDKRHCSV